MRLSRHHCIALILALFTSLSFAQTTSKADNAILGVISTKIQGMGFGNSDPRLTTTLNAIGSQLYTLINTASSSTATGQGALAPLMSATSPALNQLPLDTSGLVKISKSAGGTPSTGGVTIYSVPDSVHLNGTSTPTVSGSPVYYKDTGAYFSSAQAAALAYVNRTNPDTNHTTNGWSLASTPYVNSFTFITTCINSAYCSVGGTSTVGPISPATTTLTGPQYNCESGGYTTGSNSWYGSAGCISATTQPTLATPNTIPVVGLNALVDKISTAEKALPASPDVLSAIGNAAWSAVTPVPTSSYLPYDPTNALTVSDANEWLTSNFGSGSSNQGVAGAADTPNAPTVGDLLAPQSTSAGVGTTQGNGSGAGGSSTGTGQGMGTTANGNPTAKCSTSDITCTSADKAGKAAGSNPNATGTKIDFGQDPNISSPNADGSSTGSSGWLSSIWGLNSGITGYSAPANQGTCPTPTTTIFGKTYIWDICTLLESMRGTLQASMHLVYALAALFIVLGA